MGKIKNNPQNERKRNETKRTKMLPKVAKNVAGNGQKIINLWVGFMENGKW